MNIFSVLYPNYYNFIQSFLYTCTRMFKRKPQLKSFSNIRNSERRHLIKDVLTSINFPSDLQDPSIQDLLFPKVIAKAKYKGKSSRGYIYIDGETKKPIWFEYRGGEFCPTLYTLWKAPFLLPTIKTHAELLPVLENGADLMIRGCIAPFPSNLNVGDVVAIITDSDPKVAIAAGALAMDVTGVVNVTALHGVAVKSFHYYNDSLYKLDNEIEPDPLPSGKSIEMPATIDELHDFLKDNMESKDENGEPPSTVKEDVKSNEKPEPTELTPADKPSSSDENDTYTLSTEDVDDFFLRATLYSITQDKLDLPMNASEFMSAHILKNLPSVDANLVNMKKTSWKKSHKFFKAMEKDQLMKLKGKGANTVVVSVAGKENPKVAGFEPYKVQKHRHHGTNSNGHGSTPTGRIAVYQYLLPKSSSRELFNKLDAEYTQHYTESEVKALLRDYIKKYNLALKNDPKRVRIDSTLRSMGVKGEKRYIIDVNRSDIFNQIMNQHSNFQQYFKIVDTNLPIDERQRVKVKKGFPPRIQIRVEQIRGRRKFMTRLTGIEDYYIQPEKLAADLRVSCSGSTAITEIPNSTKMEVSVQGSHREEVIDILRKKYGIKSSWVSFNSKGGRKKAHPKKH